MYVFNNCNDKCMYTKKCLISQRKFIPYFKGKGQMEEQLKFTVTYAAALFSISYDNSITEKHAIYEIFQQNKNRQQ